MKTSSSMPTIIDNQKYSFPIKVEKFQYSSLKSLVRFLTWDLVCLYLEMESILENMEKTLYFFAHAQIIGFPREQQCVNMGVFDFMPFRPNSFHCSIEIRSYPFDARRMVIRGG